jgi:hypothetical protein
MWHGKIPQRVGGSGKPILFEPGSLGTYVLISDEGGDPYKVLPKTTCPNDVGVWCKWISDSSAAMSDADQRLARKALAVMASSLKTLYGEDLIVSQELDRTTATVRDIAQSMLAWMTMQAQRDHVRNTDGSMSERAECQSISKYMQMVDRSRAEVGKMKPKKNPPKAPPLDESLAAEVTRRRFSL